MQFYFAMKPMRGLRRGGDFSLLNSPSHGLIVIGAILSIGGADRVLISK